MPIDGATITVLSDSDTTFLATDDKGFFLMEKLSSASFQLSVSMNGYFPYKHFFLIAERSGILNIGKIILSPRYETLQKVTVTAPKKPIELKGDTLEYDAKTFEVREGAELEELLHRLPGVDMDIDGHITIRGKPVSTFLVDGKPFFGPGGLALALQNLPADIIDKVQVINDYGQQARLLGIKTGEPQNTLNIVLKPDKKNGEFGNLGLGAGNEDKYSVGMDGHRFKGDEQFSADGCINNIGQGPVGPGKYVTPMPDRNDFWSANLSYADKWGKSFVPSATYRASHSVSSMQNALLNQTDLNGASNISSSTNISSTSELKQDGIMAVDMHKATSHFNQELTYSGGNGNSIGASNFMNTQTDSNYAKMVSGLSSQDAEHNQNNISTHILYDKNFPGSQCKFSIGATISYATNNGTNHLVNNTLTVTDSLSTNTVQNYLQQNTAHNLNIAGNVNYYEPLGRQAYFELGYGYNQSNSRQNVSTGSPDSTTGKLQAIDSLSSKTNFVSISQRIHAGYIAAIKLISISANIDMLPISLSNNYKAINWTPSLQVSYHFKPNESLTMNYNGTNKAPDISQLIPTPNVTNPQYPVIGNPNLKPSLTHSFRLVYNTGTAMNPGSLRDYNPMNFSFGLNISETSDEVVTNLVHPQDNSPVIQQTEYVNANGFYTAGLEVSASLPKIFHKRLAINFSSTLNAVHSLTMIDSMAYTLQNINWSAHINLGYSKYNAYDLSANAGYDVQAFRYNSGNGQPGRSSNASLALAAGVWVAKKWRISSIYRQSFISGINQPLKAYPAILNAALQRDCLKHNKGRIILTATNLLNSRQKVLQTATANSLSQQQVSTLGTFVMLSFLLKLSKFGK